MISSQRMSIIIFFLVGEGVSSSHRRLLSIKNDLQFAAIKLNKDLRAFSAIEIRKIFYFRFEKKKKMNDL